MAPRHDTAIREIANLDAAINNMAMQLRAFEAELEEKSRLQGLGELAAHVAHEIRNPLTAMKLQAQLLCERSGNTEAEQLGQRLLGEIERLQLVVDSALAMGGPLQVTLAPGDLNTVVGEVTELLDAQLTHRHIEVQLCLGQLPQLRFDANRIKQVIFNLIINAANVLPNGGKLRISTKLVDQHVLLMVEDSGPGFEPDGSAVNAKNDAPPDNSKGPGLGLKISREIINKHDGALEIAQSSQLGGACLIITLPAALGTKPSEAAGSR